MKTIDEVINYLNNVKASFDADPADSDFQRGYEAFATEMLRVISGEAHNLKTRHNYLRG